MLSLSFHYFAWDYDISLIWVESTLSSTHPLFWPRFWHILFLLTWRYSSIKFLQTFTAGCKIIITVIELIPAGLMLAMIFAFIIVGGWCTTGAKWINNKNLIHSLKQCASDNKDVWKKQMLRTTRRQSVYIYIKLYETEDHAVYLWKILELVQ